MTTRRYTKPGNKGYRPIEIASTLLKTPERIINDRLMWWCESRNILPRFFQGFRRGKSCHDCLAPLHLDAIIAKQKKNILGVLGLDIEGTYDNVHLITLLDKLENLNIPLRIRKFISNLIFNRSIFGFRNNVHFALGNTKKGLPKAAFYHHYYLTYILVISAPTSILTSDA